MAGASEVRAADAAIKHVFAVRGVSGSGKSTAVEALRRAGDVIIDHDEHMVDENGGFQFDPAIVDACHEKCLVQYLDALRDGVTRIFISMCLSGESRLNEYRMAAERSGYRFTSVVVEHRHNGRCVHGTPDSLRTSQEEKIRASLKLS